MTESPQKERAQKSGWRDYLALAAFSYRTFIAPWPPFAFFVLATGAIAVVTPTVIVYATSGLVDAVAQGTGIGLANSEDSVVELVTPFLPWLALLLFMRLVTSLLELDPVHRFMGQQLGLRSMKKLEDSLFGKAVSLRLE